MWLNRRIFLMMSLAMAASGCSQAEIQGKPELSRGATEKYKLAVGDRLRISVFGYPEHSGKFTIDSGGNINFPLLEEVEARGRTVTELKSLLTEELDADYLVDPKISVEVLNYRPFFILGEVSSAGKYAYEPGLTVRQAVALAGGFTRRAQTDDVILRRPTDNGLKAYKAGLDTKILPGDTIEVERRLF